RHRAGDASSIRGADCGRAHRVLERPDGRLRAGPIRGGNACRRAGGGEVRRRHPRRGGRLDPSPDPARAPPPGRLGLDGGRRRTRAPGGEGVAGSGSHPGGLAAMLIAGNWKMNKTASETAEFCASLKRRSGPLTGKIDISVFPPFTSLAAAVSGLADTEIAVGAQNVHWADHGAFTGQVSAPMLRDLGVYAAIVGHSERRQYFGETDELVRRRAASALEAGLFVIACVGETESERDAGQTEDVLRRQLSVLT